MDHVAKVIARLVQPLADDRVALAAILERGWPRLEAARRWRFAAVSGS